MYSKKQLVDRQRSSQYVVIVFAFGSLLIQGDNPRSTLFYFFVEYVGRAENSQSVGREIVDDYCCKPTVSLSRLFMSSLISEFLPHQEGKRVWFVIG